jgi:squalene-hopene/tetraprenyl-beta-curcumene cyclase
MFAFWFRPLVAITSIALTMTAGADEPAKPAAEKPAVKKPIDPALAKQVGEIADRGIEFLRKSQNENGSIGDGDFAPAMTGLAIHGALHSKRVTAADPFITRGLAYLETQIREDGGIYPKSGAQRNYSTAAGILAFSSANKPEKYKDIMRKAAQLLIQDQWDLGENITDKDAKFGGAGYGGPQKTRPDLSNTAFLIEALKASGLPEDDPAFKRALVFVTRCQNYSGEGGNDLPNAKAIEDGGFYYTPSEDYNPAGGDRGKGLRSYGSMTYVGLKTFLIAGVKKDDPRVKAAMAWIRKNYTLDENPGLGQEGLYYYYHTFAKALDTIGEETLVDAKGNKRDWRADFVNKLAATQKPDGSFTNANKRWLESDPRLCTSYMLMALGHLRD